MTGQDELCLSARRQDRPGQKIILWQSLLRIKFSLSKFDGPAAYERIARKQIFPRSSVREIRFIWSTLLDCVPPTVTNIVYDSASSADGTLCNQPSVVKSFGTVAFPVGFRPVTKP